MSEQLKPTAYLVQALNAAGHLRRHVLSWMPFSSAQPDAKEWAQDLTVSSVPLYPARKLEIEYYEAGTYGAWMTDDEGNMHTVAVFAHTYAAADWCERNGFAWEVIGAVGDPAAALAAWRAEQ